MPQISQIQHCIRKELIVFLLVFMAPVCASLDRARVHEVYLEGEFDKVITLLEDYRKENPNLSRDEKVFVYKYLSVVYAANQETREKAESYMFQLLKIMPTVDLVDLYISDTIKMIFDNVKKDFEKRGKYVELRNYKETNLNPSESNEAQNSPENSQPNQKKKGSWKWVWWTAGGVALAAGVTAYVVIGDEPESDQKRVGF